jgi:hypothetical protein
MLYLGVDPGKEGGIAAVDAEGSLVFTLPTPMLAGSKPPEYDLEEIREELDMRRRKGVILTTVEKLHALPPMGFGAGGRGVGGSAANYARGVACGWLWMLTALDMPTLAVGPQTWQRRMLFLGGPDTKARSIACALALWPGHDFRRTERSRTLSDGLTDAAHLAEFGRLESLGMTPALAAAIRKGQ